MSLKAKQKTYRKGYQSKSLVRNVPTNSWQQDRALVDEDIATAQTQILAKPEKYENHKSNTSAVTDSCQVPPTKHLLFSQLTQ